MKNDKSTPGKTVDPQIEALSRSIPIDPTVQVNDEMQGALIERRVGAVPDDEPGHPDLADALANTFELNPEEHPDDQMLEAMSERRKVVEKS